MKKIILILLITALLAGCSEKAPPESIEPVAETPVYAIVVKDTTNPYMTRMYEGFAEGCLALGAEARLAGPSGEGSPSQAECIRALTAEGVHAIAIAANDSGAVSDALKEALAAGIRVVSLDSTVDPNDRQVHIQQASPEMIGRVLVQAGAQMIGGEGEIAILTTTETMPNQASWLSWMLNELSNFPEKYSKITFVEIAYGLDEYDASGEQTRAVLEKYPNLKLIIAPTVVGLQAASEVVTQSGRKVLLTGLGLPSVMESYILSGVCPWMYLWNPTEVGYLAAYAADALVNGNFSGEIGEILSAGTLGDKLVTACEDGGTEIVLGNPKMFDSTNITMWKEVF